MSGSLVFDAAIGIGLVVQFLAMYRVRAGDRRFAGGSLALPVVFVIYLIVSMTGDLRQLGWAALPLLATEVALLVAAVWAVIELTMAGIESSTADEFEARSLRLGVSWTLGWVGLMLLGATIALIALLVYGLTLLAGG